METATMETQDPVFGDVIYAYTRAQAIEDGTLVDVTETAREAGITIPVALTRAVWDAYVEVPRGKEGLQDERGRLWDVVWMLRFGILRSGGGREILYRLSVICGKPVRRRTVTLKAVCGPGDDAEPVITVMLPEED